MRGPDGNVLGFCRSCIRVRWLADVVQELPFPEGKCTQCKREEGEMSEPWEPIPPGHGDNRSDDEPVPVCPVCGGAMRRDLDSGDPLRCDLHGELIPEWVYPQDEEEA